MRPLQKIKNKHLDKWVGGWVRQSVQRRRARTRTYDGPQHLIFALCDHYEPLWKDADPAHGQRRVDVWHTGYPKLVDRYFDADGNRPKHSFFFPGEQYRPSFLEPLADLARKKLGEVEIHLHHDGDTAATLEPQLVKSLEDYARHGHISRGKDGAMRWAFIHGNWALANARADGKWCGVDEELPLLYRLGCYADYTFPSAPNECQPNFVNRIYWPVGDLNAKRCYETGEVARVGQVMRDRLLMIQGPVALARRPGSLAVRIESSALTADDPASGARARTWVNQGIVVEGRPEWLFVKVHTHGAPDKEAASLLGVGGHALHQTLTTRYNDGARWMLHYVTAREMFNIAIAAMDGCSGNPNDYRDYEVAPPPVASSG